jgi:hypothetical protein
MKSFGLTGVPIGCCPCYSIMISVNSARRNWRSLVWPERGWMHCMQVSPGPLQDRHKHTQTLPFSICPSPHVRPQRSKIRDHGYLPRRHKEVAPSLARIVCEIGPSADLSTTRTRSYRVFTLNSFNFSLVGFIFARSNISKDL